MQAARIEKGIVSDRIRVVLTFHKKIKITPRANKAPQAAASSNCDTEALVKVD